MRSIFKTFSHDKCCYLNQGARSLCVSFLGQRRAKWIVVIFSVIYSAFSINFVDDDAKRT